MRWSAIAGLAVGCLLSSAIVGQELPPAPVQGGAHDNIKHAIRWKTFEYTCRGGTKLTVYLSGTMARVRYLDKQYLMKQTVSADGNRYSDGKVVWWGKGKGGFLQEDAADGNGKMILEDCKLDKPMNTETGVVTGTVSYLPRIALPPEAVIEVKLQDVSLGDAPAKEIAEEKITLGNRQVPVAFEMKFDSGKIDEKHRYRVSARILVGAEVRFISDKAYPVLTAGNPTHVEMILKQVGGEQRRP